MILNFFSFLILVVHTLSLKNPSDATLVSLSISIYPRWRPRWRPIISVNIVCMEKCLKLIFLLKLLAMTLKSDRRHLACNQIMNKMRMRTRWPPRWQFIAKNMIKFSLRLANSRDLHTKCLFYSFLNCKHYRCYNQMMLFMHHSELDIIKIASRMVADMYYKSEGAAPYL